jgi:threonine/homoserine/homoserine lactone efflux protein
MSNMVTYLILGATYAFAAAVQPGPFQTFLISRTITNGWRRTLPAALAPLISDGPIILLTLFVLNQVPTWLEQALRFAGGVFLLYLALGAFKAWRSYQGPQAASAGSTRQSVLQAAGVNLLNPNPYLGWTLVMGPLLLKGWREAPIHGLAMLMGFYMTMVLSLAGIIILFARVRDLGPRVGRGLVAASAIALTGFGCYQLWSCTRALLGN